MREQPATLAAARIFSRCYSLKQKSPGASLRGFFNSGEPDQYFATTGLPQLKR
ncbi:hypothetical protein OCAR_7001 [Afipia carboxidovorans OM5]|nr:hypothetical protein OCAR_7001 [Afipia carboxidovorans OM5]